MTNKEVWKKWISYYNKVKYSTIGCEYGELKSIEKRFYDVVPKDHRSLMNALISCLKWHPNNIRNLLISQHSLCGHCYNQFIQNRDENHPDWGFYLEEDMCQSTCALYKRTKECCLDMDSLFEKASYELFESEFCEPPLDLEYHPKMYKACLAVYRKEYEKLYGKDWDKNS